MKLNSAVILAMLVILAGVSAGPAWANHVTINAPDLPCVSDGTITNPVVVLPGAPGSCVSFVWGGVNPLEDLAIIVTSPQPPLSCSVTGGAFNECFTVISDLAIPLSTWEIAILDGIISTIPGLNSNQIAGLDAAVGDLSTGDGLLVAACVSNDDSCGGLNTGQGASATSDVAEPPELLLLGIGMALLGLGGWKYRKLIVSNRWVSQGGLPA
jgi:hypothetical protein